MDVPILRHLRPCTQLQISGRSTNMMMAATHVSLYPTPYSDIAACIVPNNLNSIQDLTSIAKSTVLTFASEHRVYGNCCLVCGNTEISDVRGNVTCEACGAHYNFLSGDILWLHHFRILR